MGKIDFPDNNVVRNFKKKSIFMINPAFFSLILFSNLKQINLVKKQDNLLSKLLILRSRVSK